MAFIGFTEDYEKYKGSDEAKKEDNQSSEEGKVLDSDTVEPISDEDLLIITQCRKQHDAMTVYMQSDIAFYEKYYADTNEDDDDELYQEARNIRRVYKDYLKFMYATHIRDMYMDKLYEKYGGIDRFATMNTIGAIKEWIPPIPTLSRRCEDYDLYLRGDMPLMIGTMDDDYILSRVDEYVKDMDIEGMRVVAKVLTNRLERSNMELQTVETTKIRKSSNNTISGVSANDLHELQQLFSSWYHPDENTKESVNHPKQKEFFCDSPEKIEEAYYNQTPVNVYGEFDKITEAGYCEDVPDHDPDDMVVDPKTNTPMTYAEYKRRNFIKEISEMGWDSLKLMRRMGVGSSYELRMLEQKKRGSKKRKKKAMSLMAEVAGEDLSSISTLEQLNNVLFDD